MDQTILLIEDDERLGAMVREYLQGHGFRVHHATSGQTGLHHFNAQPVDALILDLMLPDIDGLDICRTIRSKSATPILMLTARGDATDRIVGLELGADDYLPKPFEPRELLARLNAILRRSSGQLPVDVLRFGKLEIDKGARMVRLGGAPCGVTGHQYDLLLVLAEHAGRVLSREQIMDLVRGDSLEAFDRSIDVHISRIRQAIEDNPKQPKRIITVRGAGYVFAKVQD
ncbi:MAG: response regulator transcription factor [Pseudomonadota bacterium]